MNLVQFIRLLWKHFWLILGMGLLMGGLVFFLTEGDKKSYSSFSIVNTGLVSGYSIEKSSNSRVDYAYVSSEFDNLINLARSYETLETLSLQLLSESIKAKKADNKIISAEGFPQLGEKLTTLPLQKFQGTENMEEILAYLSQAKEDLSHPVYALIFSDDDFFGVDHLVANLRISREGKSDMLKFTYETSDPAICKRTLELLIEIFITKQKALKEEQSTSVVNFFEEATRESADKLKSEELAMKTFRENHRIINYYEQTRFIAGKREDLYEKFNGELMKRAAAKASLGRLEDKLSERVNLATVHRGLAQKRNTLSRLQAELVATELAKDYRNEGTDPQKEKFLRARVEKVERELRENAENAFNIVVTPEGAELKNMISSWLENYLALEEANARITVMEKRKKEFEALYDNFAPLGSKLKKIERTIDVAEREYLENLHSLNQARLHQHNLMMSTNLIVVDKPFYPLKPAKSKRLLLVIVSFLAGMILVLATAIGMEYLDKSLRNPRVAFEQTKLALGGMFPHFPETGKDTRIYFEEINSLTTGLLVQNIQAEVDSLAGVNQPKCISIISVREGEGKSYVAKLIKERFEQLGSNILYIYPKHENYNYSNDWTFINNQTEQDLTPELAPDINKFSYVIIEYPSILKHQYPTHLLNKSELTLMVCDAGRVWREVDKKALQTFEKGTNQKPLLVLNKTKVDELEDFIGEVPKKRSTLRKKLKNIIVKA
ncbi:MAG: hypothetical protein AAF824_17000 [Bacteroidota bacterium]